MSGAQPREVQDSDGIRWSCLQAYAGLAAGPGNVPEDAARSGSGVRVVCTPSGGSRSVELEMPHDWAEELSDRDLLRRILEQQG